MLKLRKFYLIVGEWIDAWRIIPRLIVAGYGYLVYVVVNWYMGLQPYILENCTSTTIVDCIIHAPTNQHTALITAVVSMAVGIFGFYASSGRKWSDMQIEKKDKENAES